MNSSVNLLAQSSVLCSNLSAFFSSNSCSTLKSLSLDRVNVSFLVSYTRVHLLNDLVRRDKIFDFNLYLPSKMYLINPPKKNPEALFPITNSP